MGPSASERTVQEPHALGNNRLGLLTLPAWAYQGWVVVSGQPATTGRFTETDMVDLSASFSGAMAGPQLLLESVDARQFLAENQRVDVVRPFVGVDRF